MGIVLRMEACRAFCRRLCAGKWERILSSDLTYGSGVLCCEAWGSRGALVAPTAVLGFPETYSLPRIVISLGRRCPLGRRKGRELQRNPVIQSECVSLFRGE